MNLTKYKNKGRVGLENLGNTCFLNACMQVLSNTYELNHFLDSEKYKKTLKNDLPDSQILLEWNDLREVMWSGNGIVTPSKFVYNIQEIAKIKNKDIFTGWVQNDMSEFLLFFMECIHNSISRSVNINISGKTENNVDKLAVECYKILKETYSREYSEIMELFYGIYMSQIISKEDETIYSIKPEIYFILDLPVINNNGIIVNNLYDCFDLYTSYEYLQGDNAWYNENKKQKEDVKKQISFWNFPKILVITLKRFSPDGQQKINSLIDFPINDLDLSKYVKGYNKSSYKYDLYGICNHVGGVLGGHYTAFVKNVDNQWLHYNDSNVEIISSSTNIVTPMAYCLFYRKKNNLL
jgi:ubiquitin carboxyl-terminal hydrolase 8